MTNEKGIPTTNLELAVDWTLAHDVEETRQSIIKRARRLAERLTELADGLEQDVNYSFNTIGELQGNGVELDTWCYKLGYARSTLKTLRQAMDADAKKEAAS
ncbi:MAG: hypothetical protein AB7V46_11670 [Thermomicrobiales bacterium]